VGTEQSDFRSEWVQNSQTCTVYVDTFNNLTLCVVVCCLTNLTARLTYDPLNISVISWWSVLLVEETGVPGENH